MEAVVIIIDMQNDFVSSKGVFSSYGFNVKNLQKIIPNIKDFTKSINRIVLPLIYLISNYDDIYLSTTIRERYKRSNYKIPFCISRTWGANIVDDLEPTKNDLIVVKHRYNGFIGTNLNLILKNLNIDTLIFTGVETHVCLQQTAIHGFMLGYQIIIIEDCSASINEDDKKYALNYCKRYYGLVKSSIEILNSYET